MESEKEFRARANEMTERRRKLKGGRFDEKDADRSILERCGRSGGGRLQLSKGSC